MDILKPIQLKSLGIQIISPRVLLIQEKKFSLGPIFAKRHTKAVLDFCRIVQAESMVVDHEFYFCIWLHYLKKRKSPQVTPPPENVFIEANTANAQASKNVELIDLNFIQSCQAILVDQIGPIGKILLQKAVNSPDCQTPLQLIESISKSIPDPEKAQRFRNQFIPETDQ